MKKKQEYKESVVKDKDIDECDIVAGGAPASDMVSGAKGMTTSDVLGKCADHSKSGFFGKDCNHVPKPVFKEPMRRTKKNKEQKIKMITDAELTRKMILDIRKVDMDVIRAFIEKNWKAEGIKQVVSIAYYPPKHTIFIKFKRATKFEYVQADFDGKKFKKIVDKIYTTSEMKKEFEKILDMNGNNNSNKGSDDWKLWVIWGEA